jgi:hypothetical protein
MSTMKRVCELVECELLRSSVVSAWLGYGDPLFLQFARASRTRTDNPNNDAASCKLNTNFATWSVAGPVNGNQERDTRTRLESACQSLLGAVVHEIEVSEDGRLTLRFDALRVLKIAPWPVFDGLSDAWSVTLCGGKILAVSNAGQIAIVDSHVPIRDWFVATL